MSHNPIASKESASLAQEARVWLRRYRKWAAEMLAIDRELDQFLAENGYGGSSRGTDEKKRNRVEKYRRVADAAAQLQIYAEQWGIVTKRLREVERHCRDTCDVLTEDLQEARDPRETVAFRISEWGDGELERAVYLLAREVQIRLRRKNAPPTDNQESPPAPTEQDKKYFLGPGQSITRNGINAALSPKEFAIFQAIKWRKSVPLGELVKPSHDDAVWKGRYDQDNNRQRSKIQKAISRLNIKLLDAGVNISLAVSSPDLIVTFS